MKNLGEMMKQAQAMQGKIAEMQEKMAGVEIEGQAGAGLIVVVLNGKGEMKQIKIDPSLIDPEEPSMLEDLIAAAHNDAKGKAEARMAEEMQELTGGLGLPPGFKLPF